MKPQPKPLTLIAMLLLGAAAMNAQVIRVGNDGSDAVTSYGVKALEYVDGAQGKALRTDGYSTYATTTVDPSQIDSTAFAMSLWCAPEIGRAHV